MRSFPKRHYHSPLEWLRDLAYLFAHKKQARAIVRGQSISPAFRERIMLAVTRVNECRYCARFHTKAALDAGLHDPEIQAFLRGEYPGCPDDELPAVLYAEHWAETEFNPDPAAREKLVQTYGPAKADDIDLVLRIIKTGNFSGNTLDYLLYKISFGHFGLPAHSAR